MCVEQHSRQVLSEVSSEVILSETLQIASHIYTSNWSVANSMYHVFLGVPWLDADSTNVNYESGTLMLKDIELSENQRWLSAHLHPMWKK